MTPCEKELIELSFKGGKISYKTVKKHFVALTHINSMCEYNAHWYEFKRTILKLPDIELRRKILSKAIEVDFNYWKKLKDC